LSRQHPQNLLFWRTVIAWHFNQCGLSFLHLAVSVLVHQWIHLARTVRTRTSTRGIGTVTSQSTVTVSQP